MNKVLSFVKKWTLLCAMLVGSVLYLLFSDVPLLQPMGDMLGPALVEMVPYVIFALLYVTFCKIDISNLRPCAWHFWLQFIRTSISAFFVLLMMCFVEGDVKLVLEGCFICFICPTAASAAVVTEKLGGSIASLTVYTLIANIVTSIIIPLFFPMVEKSADITFLFAFGMIMRRVVTVLLLPLCLALLTRRYLPKVAGAIKRRKNLAFYMWAFNLSIVTGMTVHNIVDAEVGGFILSLLIILPLFVCLVQFAIGKWVGGFFGDRVSAGQALG